MYIGPIIIVALYLSDRPTDYDILLSRRQAGIITSDSIEADDFYQVYFSHAFPPGGQETDPAVERHHDP